VTSRRILQATFVTALQLGFTPTAARTQATSVTVTASASAIGLLTHSTRTPQERSLTEAYLTQPVLGVDLRSSWLQVLGMLNLEGLTLRRGELDVGAWGEGYVDRRHPHAYAHELMAGIRSSRGPIGASIYGGRGFVPFGSDDPMVRPFVSYPVDHHLAQILERLVVVGALRGGPVVVEAAAFNGDEPVDPSTAPLARRFGDSWAVRGTLLGERLFSALAGAELAMSYANVKSPEYREGYGLDQRKTHLGLRLSGQSGPITRYALLEAARTVDVDRGRDLYTFDALLGEAAVCWGDVGIAARWERSDRPEEERLLDLFRVARPATDLSILGVTEWTTLSAAAMLPSLSIAWSRAAPFVEVAHISADRTSAAVFDPVRFYGSSFMWRFSAGIRVAAGHSHGRMGRYGIASDVPAASMRQTSHDHAPFVRRCFS
jgi:hypothetical protein